MKIKRYDHRVGKVPEYDITGDAMDLKQGRANYREPRRECFVQPNHVDQSTRSWNQLVLLVCVFVILAGHNLPAQQEFPPEIAAEFAKTPTEPPAEPRGRDRHRPFYRQLLSVRRSQVSRNYLCPLDPYPRRPLPAWRARSRARIQEGPRRGNAAGAQPHSFGRDARPDLFVHHRGQGPCGQWRGILGPQGTNGGIDPTGRQTPAGEHLGRPLANDHGQVDPRRRASPAETILVRDLDVLPFEACGADLCHWSYMGKTVFSGAAHGLHPNEGFFFASVAPMSMGGPHAHVPSWEEVWIKLPPDDSYMMLGSELREMPPHTAFLAPPNYKTTHSVINTSKDQVQTWLLTARFIIELPRSPRSHSCRRRRSSETIEAEFGDDKLKLVRTVS